MILSLILMHTWLPPLTSNPSALPSMLTIPTSLFRLLPVNLQYSCNCKIQMQNIEGWADSFGRVLKTNIFGLGLEALQSLALVLYVPALLTSLPVPLSSLWRID